MKSMWKLAAGSLMSLIWSLAAAVEQADKVVVPETPVSGFWIGVFFVAFIGLCVGIGVGIYRAEKRSKVESLSQS